MFALDKVAKQIGHLLTAIERGGWTEEVQEPLDARKPEKRQIEMEIEGIEHKLKLGQIRVSDPVLRCMAEHMKALAARHPEYAQRLIRMVVVKADLFKEELRLHYTPEILLETLTLSAARGDKTGLWTVPPRRYFRNEGFYVLSVEPVSIPFERPQTGRASPQYGKHSAAP